MERNGRRQVRGIRLQINRDIIEQIKETGSYSIDNRELAEAYKHRFNIILFDFQEINL